MQQRNFGHDAGVVDQYVYPPERIDRLSDKRRHSVLVANVAATATARRPNCSISTTSADRAGQSTRPWIATSAPAAASALAIASPIPPPAPVTKAILP